MGSVLLAAVQASLKTSRHAAIGSFAARMLTNQISDELDAR
jgi:hypothetical protein